MAGTDYYRNSFTFTGAKIWNALLNDMKTELSFKTFRNTALQAPTSFPGPFPWLGGGKRPWERGCPGSLFQKVTFC